MITQSRLKEVLSYDKDTGIFIWIKPTSRRVTKNSKAGVINASKYVAISIDKKRYAAHRLAWLYVYGKFPDNNIDHIDGNPSNNSIVNLREATQQQNLYNTKKPVTNTSGYKGVHFHKGTKKWRAVVSVNNYPKHLGLFKTLEEAHIAYETWCIQHRGEFTRIGE